jgi:GNAT superfamily N-acetyltransferase
MGRAVSTTLTVRHMRRADAVSVAELCGVLGYPATARQIAARFESISRREDGRIFVADDRGAVVGWLHVSGTRILEADPYAEIAGLVVTEGMRGRGVGAALVTAAEFWAREHGYDTVRVRSNIVRIEAHAFYEHLGYGYIKTQKAFRKILDANIASNRRRLGGVSG